MSKQEIPIHPLAKMVVNIITLFIPLIVKAIRKNREKKQQSTENQ